LGKRGSFKEAGERSFYGFKPIREVKYEKYKSLLLVEERNQNDFSSGFGPS